MALTTRKRKLVTSIPKRINWSQTQVKSTGVLSTPVVNEVPATTIEGTQVTVSEGHPWPPRKGGSGDIGGDFETTRSYVEVEGERFPTVSMVRKDLQNTSLRFEYRYNGPLLPTSPTGLGATPFPSVPRSSNAELDAWGARAVARCKPTNSVADLSVALGELMRDGIPSMVASTFWKRRSRPAKAAGAEYLNAEFGWLPLVNEVRKFASVVERADSIWSQYVRDSGRVVRRRYTFPSEQNTSTTVLAYSHRPVGPSSAFHTGASAGDLVRTRETVQNRWFSGAFTYHLPDALDSRSTFGRSALLAKKLFGVTLTPDVLWNLAPWSWAVDWFSSTGDVISNLTDYQTDGLVMVYGYLMEHTIVKDTYTLTKPGLNPARSVPPLILVSETKLRRRANPFGFGITWDGLSPRQTAIAAALGLTKGRKVNVF